MQSNKNVWIGVAVALIVAIGAFYFSFSDKTVSEVVGAVDGVTNFNQLGVSQLKIGTGCNDAFGYSGCDGTAFTRLNSGTCYIKAYATTIAASSTATVACQGTAAIGSITATGSALTGITSMDNIVATLATSTAGTTSNGLVITGVSASTTAGYITLTISNLTGATYTWPTTGTATGTAYYFASK